MTLEYVAATASIPVHCSMCQRVSVGHALVAKLPIADGVARGSWLSLCEPCVKGILDGFPVARAQRWPSVAKDAGGAA